jgi:antiviral helicase SLH1
VALPPEAQGKKVDVSVYSDSYIGMKWSIEGVEIPMAPLVDDGGKKKEGGAGVWDNDNL